MHIENIFFLQYIIMVKTRARTRSSRRGRRSAARRARSSLKRSRCRGSGPAVCRAKPNCKYASGRKRSFCRKVRNTRRRRTSRR